MTGHDWISQVFSLQSAIRRSKRHHALPSRGNPAYPFIYRHRAIQEIALYRIAAVRNQKIELLLSFHAFGDDMQAKMARHAENGLDDCSIVTVGRCIVDEAFIDFQFVNRQLLEIGKTGIAGSEIVDRKTDAKFRQLDHASDRSLHVLNQQPFRYFKIQQRGIGADGRKQRAHLFYDTGMANLAWTDVDGDGNVVSQLLHIDLGVTAVFEYPVSYVHDQI